MTVADAEMIARAIENLVLVNSGDFDGHGVRPFLEPITIDDAARAILDMFPDATRQAERIAELERALASISLAEPDSMTSAADKVRDMARIARAALAASDTRTEASHE